MGFTQKTLHSRFGVGIAAGLLLGAAISGEDSPWSTLNWVFIALITILPSVLVGGLIGSAAGKDKTIQIEGMSDSEINEILEDLRKKARVPNFQ